MESLARLPCRQFSALPFAFSPLSQSLGAGGSVFVRPASFHASDSELRPVLAGAPAARLAAGWMPSPEVCSGSGQAPSEGCRLTPAPVTVAAFPARPLPQPLSRRRREHVGAWPVLISRLPGALPSFSCSSSSLLSVTLGWK